jgi:N-methylhydantoinase A
VNIARAVTLLAAIGESGHCQFNRTVEVRFRRDAKKDLKNKGVHGLDAQTDRIRLSADVGGTFTDIAAFNERTGEFSLGKTLTTPARLVDGIATGVTKAGTTFADARLFLHGTTIAINTILERTGAKCALLTTQGFRDIYEIGRVNRPESYNLFFQKHQPLIERALRFEIRERIDAQGNVLIKLDEDQVRRIADDLVRSGIDAIAILFLHSYRNPVHERRVKEIVQQAHPGLFVSASHELSQEYREFERSSTVAANAYVGPRVQDYLSVMNTHLGEASFDGTFLIVQSSGGLFDIDEARDSCIRMLESGPAAGVIGTKILCDSMGFGNAIAFDMGGTTAKAGVIHNGHVLMTGGALVGGYATGLPVQMPMIDIQEVGTGGGSIARSGLAGAMRVGPESAGAVPGPVCYGLGGEEPTITDANLVLGRLAADRFLGGEMKLDVEGAKRALNDRIAKPLGLTLTEAAEGILRIATTKMSHVVRWVTTERGLDAADFALVAYGGAGPLHAAMVARELGIGKVIIPRAPGHFSAYGMLMADLRRDFVHTWFTPLAKASFEDMEKLYGDMERRGRAGISHAHGYTLIELSEIVVSRGADMRYVGQEHAVTVELPTELFASQDRDGIKSCFDAVHETRYGYSSPGEAAEIVSLRCAVVGIMKKPRQQTMDAGTAEPPAVAFRGNRLVYFAEAGFVETPTYDRAYLVASNKIKGPALIEEYASTTVVHPGDALDVDSLGNLIIGTGRS